MSADTVKLKFTQRFKMETCRVERDVIVIREDGSFGIVKAGTIITAPTKQVGPTTVERI